MIMIKTKLPSRQRGSFYVTLTMLVLLGAALTLALKLAPAYAGNSVVKSSMASLMAKTEYKTMGIDDIRKSLIKTMQVNSLDGFDAGKAVITHDGGRDYVDINYEIRIPIVYNVSAVVEFKNRFDKD
jgi:hypothetical protein